MVLRDERDKRKSKTSWHTGCARKNKVELWWRGTECNHDVVRRRLKKKLRRKNRMNIKKNTNTSIIVSVKEPIIKQKEKKQKEKKQEKTEVCSICYECTENLKYINCKRGGVQSINFGRYGECCKDKPICQVCIVKCNHNCPFCKEHSLGLLKNKYKKKKKSFAVRQVKRAFRKTHKKHMEERNRRRRIAALRPGEILYTPISHRENLYIPRYFLRYFRPNLVPAPVHLS